MYVDDQKEGGGTSDDHDDDENEFEVFDVAGETISYAPTTTQDIRMFVTQRCIQSFMFLLSLTRDLHTVRWLDNFTQPIIINNYWDDNESSPNPGVGDTFRENDKR